jgi:hypothetical protein
LPCPVPTFPEAVVVDVVSVDVLVPELEDSVEEVVDSVGVDPT